MEDDLRPRLSAAAQAADRIRALRGFGTGLGAIILFFAWRSWRHCGAVPPWAGVSLLSWGLAAFFPAAFSPVYGPWMKVVAVLAKVNLWLVCGILYYGILTPYALVLRVFGVRPLALGRLERDSYWEVKEPRDPAVSAREPF